MRQLSNLTMRPTAPVSRRASPGPPPPLATSYEADCPHVYREMIDGGQAVGGRDDGDVTGILVSALCEIASELPPPPERESSPGRYESRLPDTVRSAGQRRAEQQPSSPPLPPPLPSTPPPAAQALQAAAPAPSAPPLPEPAQAPSAPPPQAAPAASAPPLPAAVRVGTPPVEQRFEPVVVDRAARSVPPPLPRAPRPEPSWQEGPQLTLLGPGPVLACAAASGGVWQDISWERPPGSGMLGAAEDRSAPTRRAPRRRRPFGASDVLLVLMVCIAFAGLCALFYFKTAL
jgi:hypothetical protein